MAVKVVGQYKMVVSAINICSKTCCYQLSTKRGCVFIRSISDYKSLEEVLIVDCIMVQSKLFATLTIIILPHRNEFCCHLLIKIKLEK